MEDLVRARKLGELKGPLEEVQDSMHYFTGKMLSRVESDPMTKKFLNAYNYKKGTARLISIAGAEDKINPFVQLEQVKKGLR